jgi:lipopolysaccharide biosynthesis glycosyltransferase
MNVAYSSSNYYFKPTLVSVVSLLENSDSVANVYLLSSGVSESNKQRFISEVKLRNAAPHIVEVERVLQQKSEEFGFPVMRGNYSTYARLFLAELVDADEVLLIDSDTLVVGDVGEIAHEVHAESVLLAARDFVISNKNSYHEDPDLAAVPYFNMGILWVNLKVWREKNLAEYLKSAYDPEYTLKIADQSIVNKYLHSYLAELSPRFNWYTYFRYGFSYSFYKARHNDTKFISKEEFEGSRARPIILHFIGSWVERPWYRANICSNAEEYRDYWSRVFPHDDLFEVPPLTIRSLYDHISYFVFNVFGVKAFFLFRYYLVQLIKRCFR